jgi:hypothetical protein
MFDPASAKDIHLPHPIKGSPEAYRVLFRLGDELDIPLLVTRRTTGINEPAGGHEEGAAHVLSEFPGVFQDVVPERRAVALGDARYNLLGICDTADAS